MLRQLLQYKRISCVWKSQSVQNLNKKSSTFQRLILKWDNVHCQGKGLDHVFFFFFLNGHAYTKLRIIYFVVKMNNQLCFSSIIPYLILDDRVTLKDVLGTISTSSHCPVLLLLSKSMEPAFNKSVSLILSQFSRDKRLRIIHFYKRFSMPMNS